MFLASCSSQGWGRTPSSHSASEQSGTGSFTDPKREARVSLVAQMGDRNPKGEATCPKWPSSVVMMLHRHRALRPQARVASTPSEQAPDSH